MVVWKFDEKQLMIELNVIYMGDLNERKYDVEVIVMILWGGYCNRKWDEGGSGVTLGGEEKVNKG